MVFPAGDRGPGSRAGSRVSKAMPCWLTPRLSGIGCAGWRRCQPWEPVTLWACHPRHLLSPPGCDLPWPDPLLLEALGLTYFCAPNHFYLSELTAMPTSSFSSFFFWGRCYRGSDLGPLH